MSNRPPCIGVIGGSGIYELDGLKDARWETVSSPFGAPSDQLLIGDYFGARVAFLPRHGRGHRIPPGGINFRANIDALKRFGATDVISLSAVGSLREDLPPGTFVLVDQFIDRTFARAKTFFGEGCVAHVAMAHPVCRRIDDAIAAAAGEAKVSLVRGGSYVVIEGPQFSTMAESELHRSMKASVVGMTNMPEAKLAREAELCYATIAMVTDYDCWHPSHEAVTVEQVVTTMKANSAGARALLGAAIRRLGSHPERCPAGCDRALDNAIMTAPERRDPELLKKLAVVARRVL